MLKVGVLGAGHFGKIHLKLLKQSPEFQLIGFHDSDIESANKVTEEFGYHFYSEMKSLIEAVDVIIIATPTHSHFDCAQMAIKKGKHVFIEKPISNTLEEASKIIALAKKYKVKGQIGHVERFNPAFLASKDIINNPMFIETNRLAEFNPRGTDVPVVLDLMIHDLDIILSVVNSKVKHVSASGVSVISETPDIANARIEFENGCVANLTASRISMKNMRKSRFFQKDAYISIDFLMKNVETVRIKDISNPIDEYAMVLNNAEGVMKQICFENIEINTDNAILNELESFAQSINHNSTPIVSLQQGTNALKLAYQIIKSIKTNNL
ncbi:MAG: Gfo/Idh/MocA family oxidoreductase [Flavobacteriaceae bacterium]|nr:Gfo/Idh/MocA family oxidoreductase [Flavobacteriaceae bacterium]